MKIDRLKPFLILLLLVCSYTAMYAQENSPMTDQQVIEFIIKEKEKGTAQETIVKRLVERGVPVTQLQRIRRKYERQNGSDQLGARDLTGKRQTEDRLRQGSSKNGNGRNQDRKDRSNQGLGNRPRVQNDQDTYGQNTDFLFPDTTGILTEFFPGKETKSRIFGHDIFQSADLSFTPEMNIPTPSDYRLGAGDAVMVDVWGASVRTFSTTVSPEGCIDIEGFGPIQVGGMTVGEAGKRVRSVLGGRFSGSQIRLSIGETKSITVNVMGAVNRPGTFTLSAFATVFHALYMAGGPTEIGTLRSIKVYRQGREISTVDLYDYILNGKMTGDIRLASGDVIIVSPYDCLVEITGKVKRPMLYEMKKTESLATLIAYAGGFRGDAWTQQVRLVRKSGNQMSVHTIDEFDLGRFQMMDGDSVAVDSTLQRFSNMVEIRGAVFRPGMYQTDGIVSTVGELIARSGGLKEDAMSERGVMHRRKEDRTLEVLAINLKGIVEHTEPDIALRNEDILYVPSRNDLTADRKLTIFGEVFYPGEYEYADNTTLEDLILQAGGLTDAASLVKVDVSRRVNNPQALQSQTNMAETYTFSLKDGFVVQGTPGFTLKPFDEVYVRRSPGYSNQQHVTVEGEVAFGGQYTITNSTYRLSNLIKDCGGLSEGGYAKGAVLIRRMTEDEKIKQKNLRIAASSDDSVDMRKLDFSTEYNVGINLEMALQNPGSERWDIVLREGDRLFVPQFNNTVSINGEVLFPNTIAYRQGAKASYYIDQAGGFSTNARKSRIFAVHMNGTVTPVKSAKDIQPGCCIVVPSKSKKRNLSVTEIISMGSITATLAAVIATIVK